MYLFVVYKIYIHKYLLLIYLLLFCSVLEKNQIIVNLFIRLPLVRLFSSVRRRKRHGVALSSHETIEIISARLDVVIVILACRDAKRCAFLNHSN